MLLAFLTALALSLVSLAMPFWEPGYGSSQSVMYSLADSLSYARARFPRSQGEKGWSNYLGTAQPGEYDFFSAPFIAKR